MRKRRLTGIAFGLAGFDLAAITLAMVLAQDGYVYNPTRRDPLWPGLLIPLLFFTVGMYLMAWYLVPPDDDASP